MSFTWAGVSMALLDHPYNATLRNERAVEIPAALWFLAGRPGTGLEVGNVLGHYGCEVPRRVVDLYEHGEGVENIDVATVDGRFDWIVAISTLEHVGWDDRHDPFAALEALDHLRGLLEADGVLFVTVPMGWHPSLDAAIEDGSLGPITETAYAWHRGDWDEVPARTWAPYDHEAHHANIVWIAELGPITREDTT